MLKHNKRYPIDIINSLCLELGKYFYAFFYSDKSYYDIIKSINLEHGGKIIQRILNFFYYRPPAGGRLFDMKILSSYVFLQTY